MLKSGAQAISAGTAGAPTVDIRGVTRSTATATATATYTVGAYAYPH